MKEARSVRVRGVVQGVGFRPFVFRIARANGLGGWVVNEAGGVAIHVEGEETGVRGFLDDLTAHPPPAATITDVDVRAADSIGLGTFTIDATRRDTAPTARISADLPVCQDCLRELRDPGDPRYRYPYINCTACGPRYSVIERLPYDRANTTMSAWPMDSLCDAEYGDPANRRFHAQPVACPTCGPEYRFEVAGAANPIRGWPAIEQAVLALGRGALVAVKGIGGYHLACDARDAAAVAQLRLRKFRKEKPFAVMARDLAIARTIAELGVETEGLLLSAARPIVLASKKAELPDVAPDTEEFGLMLPYAPIHYLLFEAGAPDLLVMTSANRSSEPIAFRDGEARSQLLGIADAFLAGERPIARRVDDSVARVGPLGPMILRRSRGYAPGAAAVLPVKRPVLALGGDLKNTVTTVVDGQAFVSQHIGDLDDIGSREAFQQTIRDLMTMYDVDTEELLLAHDAHPGYSSTSYAAGLPAARKVAVQHHRAHIASVIAERGAWEDRVIGISLDGAGYGDDGSIWGGELFVGSLAAGFDRALHLRPALLVGGDAAARFPVQAAAGFLAQMETTAKLDEPPFSFPVRYRRAMQVARSGARSFVTTSAGRLFDTVAALLGFTREITFEGQAAMWLEQLACRGRAEPYPMPLVDGELDFRPLLEAVITDRLRDRAAAEIARAFHCGIAQTLRHAAEWLRETQGSATVVLSGGVFQNRLLLAETAALMTGGGFRVWTNSAVPPNDGGISLGQAAIAAFCEERRA